MRREAVYEFVCAGCGQLVQQVKPVERCACGVVNDVSQWRKPLVAEAPRHV